MLQFISILNEYWETQNIFCKGLLNHNVINNEKIITQSSYISEEVLVRRLRERDKSALDYLYERYGPALYGTVLSILGSEELAQEVLHDAFLKIWNNILLYEKGKGRLFTWMLNITRNQAIDKVRSKELSKERKTDKVEDNVHTIENASFDTVFVDGIGVKEVVKNLSEDYQLVVELMYFRGYTQSEISKEYNIPLGTVKTRTRAALKELRKILQ